MDKPDDLPAEKILDLLEQDTSKFKFSHRSHLLGIAFKKLEETKDKEKLERIRKEALIQSLYTPFNEGAPRFRSMMSGTTEEGKVWEYPDIKNDFPEESINYYKERIKTSKNPVLVSRYCDFLWFYKKDFEYAVKAVESYLDCADVYLANNWNIELTDSLLRVLEISVSINNELLKKKSISKSLDVIITLRKNKDYRFLIEIIKGLTRLPDYVSLSDLAVWVEEALSHFKNNVEDSYRLQRSFLELLIEIYKILDPTKKEGVDLRIAKSLVEEAEWKRTHHPNGSFIASSIYQEALKKYNDLGKYPTEVEKIKVIIQELNNSPQKSFKTFTSEISIPKKTIDDYMSRFNGKTTRDSVEIISIDKNLIPDYEISKKSAIKNSKEFVFQNIIPISLVRGSLEVKKIIEDDDKIEFNSIRDFQLHYKMIAGVFLSEIFEFMESNNPDYIDDLLKFISDCQFVRKNRITLIKSGLASFKEKNYVASIHTLVFQVEGILRDMLESMRVSTFTYRNSEMRARLFSDIVDTLYLVEGLDKNFVKLIDIFLSNIQGDNLRNDIAHGLSELEVFSRENNLLIILIIIKICSYKIIELNPD